MLHTETSHLIYTANHVNSFYIKWNTGLDSVNEDFYLDEKFNTRLILLHSVFFFHDQGAPKLIAKSRKLIISNYRLFVNVVCQKKYRVCKFDRKIITIRIIFLKAAEHFAY